MRITMRSTSEIVLLNGRPCRVWDGITDRAVQVRVFVAAISVPEGQHAQLAEELIEQPPPVSLEVLARGEPA